MTPSEFAAALAAMFCVGLAWGFEDVKRERESDMVDDRKEVLCPLDMERHDISIEQWREYVWPNAGSTEIVYRIEAPETLFIRTTERGDSHRVVDVNGVVHYIPAGWQVMRWKVKPGNHDVLF